MKWRRYAFSDSDPRARKQIFANLAMGATQHALTRKLLSRFSEATGSYFAIAFEFLDVDRLPDFSYATYSGGKRWYEAAGTQDVSQGDSPIGGLICFLREFLRSSKEAVVLCENWGDSRTEYLANWRPRESRVVYHAEDVYHVLTSKDDDDDSIECVIRESRDHWATGVCSSCSEVPQGDILQDGILNAIVANTRHIFTPALDGEGYLVWSPIVRKKNRELSHHRRTRDRETGSE